MQWLIFCSKICIIEGPSLSTLLPLVGVTFAVECRGGVHQFYILSKGKSSLAGLAVGPTYPEYLIG